MTAFLSIVHRLRPPVGWGPLILALLAALCPALAAVQGSLRLPSGVFFWAGLLGIIVGLDGAPREGDPARAPRRFPLRLLLHALVWVALGALLVVAAGEALPPLGLIAQDGSALLGRALVALGRPGEVDAPADRTSAFLGAALARLWRQLAEAPGAGEAGGRLILATGGVALTWAGALALGRGLPAARALLAWELPLLAAIAATAVLGGAGGWPLALGLLLLLVLAALLGFSRRRGLWERSGIDYSDELGRDVVLWSGLLAAAMLLAAWALPLWPGNPVARALAELGASPSGIAALERGIERPRAAAPTVEVGLSTLPSLLLGTSLEQGPPEEIALRVRLDRPLPPAATPHYWRARVFDRYIDSGWAAEARVSAQEPASIDPAAVPGAIVQDIEDMRSDVSLIVGLPDVIAVSIPTNAERFEDGALAALTGRPPEQRYRLLSRPQELADLPPADRAPPDMAAYLALPRDLPPRVRELAQAVAGDQRGAYAQALALETYLRRLPYAYRVEPIPRDGDAVDQFLFEMRSGYCTYYATSMVVMARSLGIPARLATGYYTGEPDESGLLYTVREADAHAWPELYVNQRWTPFEPTPVRPLPARAAPQAGGALEEVSVAAPEMDRVSGPLFWLAAAGVAGLLVYAAWRMGRRPPPLPPVTQAQLRLERNGERAGVVWPAGATLQEYRVMLAPRLDSRAPTRGDSGEALRDLVGLIELARYGGHGLTDEELRRLHLAEERLWGSELKEER